MIGGIFLHYRWCCNVYIGILLSCWSKTSSLHVYVTFLTKTGNIRSIWKSSSCLRIIKRHLKLIHFCGSKRGSYLDGDSFRLSALKAANIFLFFSQQTKTLGSWPWWVLTLMPTSKIIRVLLGSERNERMTRETAFFPVVSLLVPLAKEWIKNNKKRLL